MFEPNVSQNVWLMKKATQLRCHDVLQGTLSDYVIMFLATQLADSMIQSSVDSQIIRLRSAVGFSGATTGRNFGGNKKKIIGRILQENDLNWSVVRVCSKTLKRSASS